LDEQSPPRAGAERFLRYGLLAFLVLLAPAVSFNTPDPSIDIKWLIISWAAIGLTVGWVVVSWLDKTPVRLPTLFPGQLAALLIVLSLALIPSEFPWHGVPWVVRLVLLAAVYFVATQVLREEAHVRTVMLWMVGVMLFTTFYAFLQAANLDPLGWDRTSDVYQDSPSTFGHPNFAAHALLFVIVFALYLASVGKAWAIFPAVAFVIYLSETGQRAGWLALAGAAAIVVLGWIVGRVVRGPFRAAVVTLAVTVALGLAGLFSYMAFNQVRSGSVLPLDSSLILRYQSFVSAGDMFFERPLYGHGPGNYGIKNPAYWTPYEQEWFAQERRMNRYVHNDLIEFGIEGGMVAAGFYLSLLLTGILGGLLLAYHSQGSRRRLGFALAAVFTAFGIDGLFGFNLRVPVSAAFFFVTMAMLDGLWSRPRLLRERYGGALRWGLAALVVVAGFQESRLFSGRYDMQRGLQAQAQGNLELADERLRRAARKAPYDWRVPRQRGLQAMAQGEFEDAAGHFERVLEINPYEILANLPLAQSRMFRAQRMLQENPENAGDAVALLDIASVDVGQLIAYCPMDPSAHEVLGRIATISGSIASQNAGFDEAATRQYWETAAKHFAQAIEYQPEPEGALFLMLAQVRLSLDDVTGAERVLSDAIQRQPGDMARWNALLDLATEEQRYDQARNIFLGQIDVLRKEDPIDPDALATANMLMANLQENGYRNLGEAQRGFVEAASLRPDRLDVWSNFANFALRHNRLDVFRTTLLRAQSTAEDTGLALPETAQAVALQLIGGPDALQRATEVMLAVVRSQRDRPERMSADDAYDWAVRMLEQAAERGLEQTLCIPRFNLALCRNALNDYEAAEAGLQSVESCLPAELEPLYAVHYADALVGLGRTTQALLELEQALADHDGDLELRWAYARTLGRIGLYERSYEEYQRLLNEPDIETLGRRMIEDEMEQVRDMLPVEEEEL